MKSIRTLTGRSRSESETPGPESRGPESSLPTRTRAFPIAATGLKAEPRDAYAMAAGQAPRPPVTPARAPADDQQAADVPSRSWLSPFIASGIQPPIFVQRDT
jgi:hypothetical protein